MKRTTLSLLATLLTLVMLLGAFAGCAGEEQTTQGSDNPPETSSSTEQTTDSHEQSDVSETESQSETTSGSQSETTDESKTESGSEIETDPVGPSIEDMDNGTLIQNAQELANGVNAYFNDGNRLDFTLENQKMYLEYALASHKKQQVTALKNSTGNIYIANTADVYVKDTSGSVFYASDSSRAATANLYRFGYYYYEARFEEQLFNGQVEVKEELPISLDNLSKQQVKTSDAEDGSLCVTLAGSTDPFILIKGLNASADTYNYLKLTVKTDTQSMRSLQFYVNIGSGINEGHSKYFTISPVNEYVTYYIPLSGIKDYSGTISQLRFDFAGAKMDNYWIKEMAFVQGDDHNPPMALGLNRSFLIYSDKLHHYLQIAADKVAATNIAEVGMETKIDADTVAAIVIKDKDGVHNSLEGVDFATVEYVGFDIKNAGIFGYILPADNSGGQLKVELNDGVYTVLQFRTPENNTIEPSGKYNEEKQKYDPIVPLNGNDFYMGQRIYTDETHDFETFLYEAELERNPLSAENFIVDTAASTEASFAGYDAIRGIYTFHVQGDGFNGPYFQYPNKHYNVKFTVKGDDKDRNIYIMTLTDQGCLECAVLLDEKDMMLPIPIEVGKNFSEATGERNLWNIEDDTYGEAIIPMVIKAGSEDTYNFINLYQNWGRVPLKQVSWIQYYAPYYHLSTGVTETNCIVPYYSCKNARGLATLPDHRAMSAPLWAGQPQHNSGGSHRWLCYTDAEGNFVASENTKDTIDSYGPTYADVIMDYLTDDGKIKINYVHSEFPQTDENRAYYEMKYEVLDDVNIADFSTDFYFYRITDNDPTGVYQNVGYLNQQNECVIVDSVTGKDPVKYVLGDNCPYFSFFNMKDYTSDSAEGYTNLAFLIHSASFVINGEKVEPNFVIVNEIIDGSNYLRLSLDLGEVTLKAGDHFEINAIVMPWGSQASIYNSPDYAGDVNVRNVRENSLLHPLTATAGANTQVLDSIFVPKVRSTDGKSAEFTLTGGQNNCAVRIYGFDSLTVPVIEEQIKGKWIPYKVSSAYYPDRQGNAHYYDGYSVYYDEDGTFSYAFVIPMDYEDEDGRTFRISTEKAFEGWPEKLPEIEIETEDLPLNAYMDAEELSNQAILSGIFAKVELNSIENFVTLAPSEREECYFLAYPGGTETTGQYFVMKYRLPSTNTDKLTNFEIFTSTVNKGATGSDCFYIGSALINDGNWQVVIVDLASYGKATFAPAADGTYKANFLRLDPFNERFPTTNNIDLAFVGLSDNLSDIYALCGDMEYISFLAKAGDKATVSYVSPTGEAVAPPEIETEEETKPTEDEVIEDAVSSMAGYNVYLNATSFVQAAQAPDSAHFGAEELKESGKYARIHYCNDPAQREAYRKESYFKLYTAGDKKLATGQYLVIKYRLPEQIGSLQFYTSTGSKSASDSSTCALTGPTGKRNQLFIGDNQWHVVIVDLSKAVGDFKADSNGKYAPNFLRIDFFNFEKPLEEGMTTYVDIEYFGLTDNYEEALGHDKSVTEVSFYDGTETKTISVQ